MLDHAGRDAARYPNLKGKRILVVEDDAIVAVDYYFQLREVGASPQAYEPTNQAALDYLANHEVDAVIVDYRLRDGPCEPVIALLEERRIPYIVVSGSFSAGALPTLAGKPRVLSKPVTPDDIWSALSAALH